MSEPKSAGRPMRVCKHCGKPLWPWYCNQRVHRKCWPTWRRKYFREYQRRQRRELKQSWEEPDGNEA
ncbi:MAG: hypothetical protein HY748_00855 [Elusimicrobia bacterium]|nr:hypothetical protein [Elusimicrobiota bacterium]